MRSVATLEPLDHMVRRPHRHHAAGGIATGLRHQRAAQGAQLRERARRICTRAGQGHQLAIAVPHEPRGAHTELGQARSQRIRAQAQRGLCHVGARELLVGGLGNPGLDAPAFDGGKLRIELAATRSERSVCTSQRAEHAARLAPLAGEHAHERVSPESVQRRPHCNTVGCFAPPEACGCLLEQRERVLSVAGHDA